MPFDFQKLMMNPQFQLGMGMLAGSGPGTTLADTAQGGLLGLQNYQQAQAYQARMDALRREQEREEQERAWMAREGMGGMPPWAAKAQTEARLRQQYGTPEYGTTIQYIRDLKTGQILPAQMSKTGGLFYIENGKRVPFNPEKHQLIRPYSPLDLGSGYGAFDSLRGGMPSVTPPAQGSPMRPPNVPSVRTSPMPGAFPEYIDQNGSRVPFQENPLRPGEELSPNSPIRPVQPGVIPKGISPQEQPSFKAEQAAAKKRAEIEAEKETTATLDFPAIQEQTEQSIRLLDELLAHPGLGMAVGKSSVVPVIPGTAQADFVTRLEQIQGQQFLEAYQQLKGGGQITEVEGKKAEAAIARMSREQSEPEFKRSVKDFRDALIKGLKRKAKKEGIDWEYSTGGLSTEQRNRLRELERKYGVGR